MRPGPLSAILKTKKPPNRAQLLHYLKTFSGATGTDKSGRDLRNIYNLQYIQGDGTGYLASPSLAGSETVSSKQGTATVTIAAGRVNLTAGTLWSFVLSNGSTYEFGSLISSTTGIVFDTSGNQRHLLMTGFSNIITACASSATVGTDCLNQQGYSVVTSSNMVTDDGRRIVEVGSVIPIITGGSGVMPITDFVYSTETEILSNAAGRGFDSDIGYWILNTGWSIAGGKAVMTAATGQNFARGGVCAINKLFKISFEAVLTTGSVAVQTQGLHSDVCSRSSTFTTYLDTVNGSGDDILSVFADYIVPSNGTIDNISVKELIV